MLHQRDGRVAILMSVIDLSRYLQSIDPRNPSVLQVHTGPLVDESVLYATSVCLVPARGCERSVPSSFAVAALSHSPDIRTFGIVVSFLRSGFRARIGKSTRLLQAKTRFRRVALCRSTSRRSEAKVASQILLGAGNPQPSKHLCYPLRPSAIFRTCACGGSGPSAARQALRGDDS